MVNGYEDVFGINNCKKIFDVIDEDKLFHKTYHNGPVKTSNDLGASTLMFGFAEQIVGREVYEKVDKAYNEVKKFKNLINTYQSQRNDEINERKDVNGLRSELSSNELKIKHLSSKIELLTAEEQTKLINLILQHQKLEKQIADFEYTSRPDANKVVDAIKSVKESKENADKDELSSKISSGMERLLANEGKMKQAFVDCVLYPDQKKEERLVRMCGDAMFDLVKIDLTAIRKKMEIVDDISKFYEENDIETPIPQEILKKMDVVYDLDWLYDFANDNSFAMLEDSKCSSCMNECISALKKVKFGKERMLTEHEVFNIGKVSGLSQQLGNKKDLMDVEPLMRILSSLTKNVAELNSLSEKYVEDMAL